MEAQVTQGRRRWGKSMRMTRLRVDGRGSMVEGQWSRVDGRGSRVKGVEGPGRGSRVRRSR
eukprot:1087790-Rhodomonas_salina.2